MFNFIHFNHACNSCKILIVLTKEDRRSHVVIQTSIKTRASVRQYVKFNEANLAKGQFGSKKIYRIANDVNPWGICWLATHGDTFLHSIFISEIYLSEQSRTDDFDFK